MVGKHAFGKHVFGEHAFGVKPQCLPKAQCKSNKSPLVTCLMTTHLGTQPKTNTGTDREQSNFFVASDVLYCYLLHVYRYACFTRAQGPNDHWIHITIISNVVIINHENNSHLLFFVCHPCRVQTQDLPDHMFSNFVNFQCFFVMLESEFYSP